MNHDADMEAKCAQLRRWRTETNRQDSQLLQDAWRAVVRSHTLLARPVYTATRKSRPGGTTPQMPGQGSKSES